MKTSKQADKNSFNDKNSRINFFYQNKMWSNYKIDEKHLNAVVKKNVTPVDKTFSIDLNIFNKGKKLKNILMKNKSYKSTSNYNVVYQYTCSTGGCNFLKYIGYTEQTLEDRFRQHQSVMKHLLDVHNMKMKRKDILKSVEILYQGRNMQELLIMEALFIVERKLLLNNQEEGRDRM